MIRKVFKQMTVIQIMSAVTVTVCLLIDSIMIGRFLGVEAMSSYGLANPVIILFTAMGTMLSCGVQVQIGEAMGRGDVKACSSVFSTSFMMSLIISAVWIAVVFLVSKPLCLLLAASDADHGQNVLTMTSEYLKGYIIGAPFFFLSQSMIPFLQAMGRRRLTVISVIAMTISDIVFDFLSVFVFNGGMFGIGLASALSHLAALLAGCWYFMKKDSLFRFSMEGVNAKMAAVITYSGSPIIVNQACFMLRVYVINQMLLSVYGTLAVAVYSVVSTIGNIFFSVGLGAGAITLMLASIFHSEEDRSSLYELVHVMIQYSFRLIVGCVIIVELTAPLLIRLFLGDDPEIHQIAVPGLRLYIISLIAVVLTTVFKNYYQGTGHMLFTDLISVGDNVVFLLPPVIIFGKLFGLTGIWNGIIFGQCLTLVFISVVVWVRYGRISFSAEAYSMLGPDFGADPADVYEAAVTDIDAAISASEQIDGFCRSKGLENRLANLVSLCVEEIVVNIIDHGFTKDELEHQADVRLVIDKDKCIIRVRDNCIGFDPVNYLELHQSDDPSKHIGIRIVTSMVKDINYINSLGLNNLYMSFDI